MALIPVLVFSLLILTLIASLLPQYVVAMNQFTFADPTIEFLFKLFVPLCAIIVLGAVIMALANFVPSLTRSNEQR